MKFALIDAEGFPVAYYAPEVHGAGIPSEAVGISEEQWIELIENGGRRKLIGGKVVVYDPPAQPLTLDDYRRAIQSHIDEAAQARNYDSGATCAGYAASTVPAWAAEAAAFIAWRDAVWAYAFTELGKVEAGTRPQPSVAEIIAEIEAITWPE